MNRITAITIATLKYAPDLCAHLARRSGGIDVWSGGRCAFTLWIPHTTLGETKRRRRA